MLAFLLGTVYKNKEVRGLSRSADFTSEASVVLFYMKLSGVFFRSVIFVIWLMQVGEQEADLGRGYKGVCGGSSSSICSDITLLYGRFLLRVTVYI